MSEHEKVLPLARRGGTWSIEQTAIANSIEVNRRLEAGWPVKVPVRVAYVRARTGAQASPICGAPSKPVRNPQGRPAFIRNPSTS